MEDILKQTIKESLGKSGKIILKNNNWKYDCKIIASDENHIKFLDYKYSEEHIIRFDEVKDFIRSAN